MNVCNLDLSVRTMNVLKHFEIKTLEELLVFDAKKYTSDVLDYRLPDYRGMRISLDILKEINEFKKSTLLNRRSMLLTYMVYASHITTLPKAIKDKIGCELDNRDIFSLTCKEDLKEGLKCTLVVIDSAKFDLNNIF